MLSSALLRLQNLLLTMSEMTTNRGGPTSLSPNDPLYKLIVNTPDFNSNPVGSVARNALVSKLKSSLPGRHSEVWREGQRFVDIFFPNHSTAPYEEDVTAQTGLNEGGGPISPQPFSASLCIGRLAIFADVWILIQLTSMSTATTVRFRKKPFNGIRTCFF